jgi:hypothetical protein
MLGSCHDKEISENRQQPCLRSIKTIAIFYMPDRLPLRFYRSLRAVGCCAKSLFTPRCGCPRCVDPTEFGTNTSGLPCGSCQGLLLPQVTTTESEHRVSSGGVHFARMSLPVIQELMFSYICHHRGVGTYVHSPDRILPATGPACKKKGGKSPSSQAKLKKDYFWRNIVNKYMTIFCAILLFLCFMKTVIPYQTQRFHCLKQFIVFLPSLLSRNSYSLSW